MRRSLLLVVLVVLSLGCTSNAPPPSSSTISSSTTTPTVPSGVTTTSASTTTSTTLPTPSGVVSAGPASPAGAPFDPVQWEEPAAPPPADKIAATSTSEWTLRVAGQAGALPGGARLLA